MDDWLDFRKYHGGKGAPCGGASGGRFQVVRAFRAGPYTRDGTDTFWSGQWTGKTATYEVWWTPEKIGKWHATAAADWVFMGQCERRAESPLPDPQIWGDHGKTLRKQAKEADGKWPLPDYPGFSFIEEDEDEDEEEEEKVEGKQPCLLEEEGAPKLKEKKEVEEGKDDKTVEVDDMETEEVEKKEVDEDGEKNGKEDVVEKEVETAEVDVDGEKEER